MPILKQLIEQVKSLQGGDLTGYQKKSDNSLETTSKEVVGAINEVNSQYKDIAKKVENVGSPTDEQMETAVNSYFGKHPITGGLTNAQISALNEMFKVCAYIKNDISTEYNNFKTAFKIGLKNYTITNNLANCTSSNSITSVQEGSSYNATITANNNYILQAPTITMGGTDVTSSVYSNGVISITKVTGNIVITCNAIKEIKPELLKDVATLDKKTSTATGTWHKTQCRYKLSVKVGDIITIANTRYSYNNNQCQLFVYDGTNTNSDFYKPYCVLNDDDSVSYTVQADADTFYVSFVPDDTKSNIIRANS